MITQASDCALLISFGESYSEEAHVKVRRLVRLLRGEKKLFLREIQPAYGSVLVTFDLLKTDAEKMTRALRPMVVKVEREKGVGSGLKARRVEIPVCYGGGLGPDLADVAGHAGMGIEDVISLHSSVEYTVCFFGFMPGFSYWSGLPERLAVPRLAVPRTKVAAGSVGIGGSQTGIYPMATPGGWRIIGRTPIRMFDPKRKGFCYLRLGDRVRLKAISVAEFERLGGTWER